MARVRHAPNLKLSQHTHPHTCIVLPVKGTFVETSGSRAVFCTPGYAVIEHAGRPHENVFGRQGALNIVVRMQSPVLERVLENRLTTAAPTIALLAERLLQAFDEPLADDLECESLLLDVLSCCLGVRPGRRREPAHIVDAIRIIWSSPREARSVSALARMLGVSPIRLARSFRKRYGLPIRTYICSVRESLAWSMLRSTGLSLCDIALELGYSDQAHMTRTLRKYRNATPGTLRRLHGQVPHREER